MSKITVDTTEMAAIGNAIRAKLNVETAYKPGDMPAAILSIPSGITPTGTISITGNGDYDVTNYAAASVNVPGGGRNVTFGYDMPSDAYGANGDIFILTKKGGDSGVGWYVTETNALVQETGSMGTINGRSYVKTTSDPAIVVFCPNGGGYWQPHMASTIPDACKYSAEGAGPWNYNYSYEINNIVWYFFSGNYGFSGTPHIMTDYPVSSVDYTFSTQQNAEDFLASVGMTIGSSPIVIADESYIKTDGTWTLLKGAHIEDVI